MIQPVQRIGFVRSLMLISKVHSIAERQVIDLPLESLSDILCFHNYATNLFSALLFQNPCWGYILLTCISRWYVWLGQEFAIYRKRIPCRLFQHQVF